MVVRVSSVGKVRVEKVLKKAEEAMWGQSARQSESRYKGPEVGVSLEFGGAVRRPAWQKQNE